MLPFPAFETAIDEVILERGRQYYDSEAVEELAEQRTNEWRATVLGSADYTVELTLDGDRVIRWHCNCPYDGTVCKHVVATLFALREVAAPPASEKGTPQPESRFDQVLEKLRPEELREFIRVEKDKDQELGERLLLYFASKNPEADPDLRKRYQRLVKSIIKRYTRRGFMEYSATFRFAKDMEAVIDAARTALHGGAYAAAIGIAEVICEAIMELITHADDSAANISYCLESGIGILASVVEQASTTSAHLDRIYTWLEQNLVDDIWFDYGNFGSELLDVAATIGERIDPERHLRLLDTLLDRERGKEADFDYFLRDFTKRKVHFLRATGRVEQADDLLADNLEIVALRQDAVDAALAAREYEQARSLAETGIEIAREKGHPGTVRQWQETLARIAERSGDTEAFRAITLQLAIDTRGFQLDYYRAWKNSFPAEERAVVVEQLIQSIIDREQAKPEHPRIDSAYQLFLQLTPLYIEEQRWEDLARLLPADRKHPSNPTPLFYSFPATGRRASAQAWGNNSSIRLMG